MSNAKNFSCEVIYNPTDIKYSEDIRMFQGCPTIAVTKGGRIFLGWYAGGLREPSMDNYNLLVYSDDKGKTWSEQILVIPSSYERNVHALDIQLFLDPKGALHVQWVQNNTRIRTGQRVCVKEGQPIVIAEGYVYDDFAHTEWEIVCENPDAEVLEFSQPRYVYPGFLRCKPTFLTEDKWLSFAYDQLTDTYGYNLTEDGGKTYKRIYGGKKCRTSFDEAMAYEMNDGRIRMLARTSLDYLAESYSSDGGFTWTDGKLSNIPSADSRFYIERLPSGNILLVLTEIPQNRQKMVIYLSDDDGKTFKYSKCIDNRCQVSYPDVDIYGDEIYLTYDCERTGAKEILFAAFKEEDIMSDNDIEVSVISKPKHSPKKEDTIKEVLDKKFIAILRNIPKDKIVKVTKALYDGGITLVEVPFPNTREGDIENAEKIKLLVEEFGDKMLIGSGTVFTEHQVRLTKGSGGSFIISPDTNPAVIIETVKCGMVSIPGVYTPTEIKLALDSGADFVKLFPANGSAPFIKAVLAPMPNARIVAVGGVNDKNLKEFLDAGAVAIGVGSAITDKKLIDNEDYNAITELALKYTEQL